MADDPGPRGGRKTSRPIRVVAPPPPAGPPVAAMVAGALILAALVGGGIWFATRPRPVVDPSPSPTSDVAPTRTPAPPAAPDPALVEARAISLSVRKVLDDTSDRMAKSPHSVKSPYPWKPVVDKYKAIVRTVRGHAFERDFWLEHTREVAVSIARLSSAVAADPDAPDAPTLLTVGTENARGKDYDATIRQVAGVVSGPAPVNKLMEICFLIVSGDTQAATDKIAKLPPLPPGEDSRLEEACRLLARVLLAYGVKKGTTPLDWARKGLLMIHDQEPNATQAEWEWALLIVYSSVPSLFHDNFGKRDTGHGVVDRGLVLLGRTGAPRPRFFDELDFAMVTEVRKVIRDAGKRGLSILGPESSAGPPVKDLVMGASTARWMTLATDPGPEEGKLWYGVYLGWLLPGAPALKAAGDPDLKKALADLDQELERRAKTEGTGVMSACRARLSHIRGDTSTAAVLLSTARAKAEKAGFKEKDESIWEGLDRLAVELRSGGASPAAGASPSAAPSPGK